MKVLANDGIANSGVKALEDAGFEVQLNNIAQESLEDYINENQISVLLVRSATKVRKNIIDNCPSLKVIGRGGVGMDNIDVEYARNKGLQVINTPGASSHAVAELVFAHLLGMVRYLPEANRNMPLEGDSKFKELKKSFAKGSELRGKTLGLIGFGRIGQAAAKIGIGLGMKIIAFDPFIDSVHLELEFFDHQTLFFEINTVSKEEVLKEADVISLHVPAQNDYIIGEKEFRQMKPGSFIINAARGGVVDEVALVDALENGTVRRAALDVFENEPTPEIQLLMNSSLSLSPHIGAATSEAQDRIGIELAEQIIEILS
jgi:D-3-phosphoglycerate dehydrogenase